MVSTRSHLFLTFCIFLYHLITTTVFSKDCLKLDQCKCVLDDGSGVLDLSLIGNKNGTPLINDVYGPDNYIYSYNPCYPFTEITCTNCSACRHDYKNFNYYTIGEADNVSFSFDGTNTLVTYGSEDGIRSTVVTFICDPSVDVPTYTVHGQTSIVTYSFTVTTKHACATGISTPTSPPTPTPSSPPTSINPNTKPSCKRKTDCSCLFNDGTGEMDLSGLGRTDGTPLINNVLAPDGFGYSFNPCYPFNLEKCTNAAACRFDCASKTYKNIGSSSGVEYLYDGNNVVGTYISRDGKTKTMVTYICDLHTWKPRYNVIGEIKTGIYNITITTRKVCPTSCDIHAQTIESIP